MKLVTIDQENKAIMITQIEGVPVVEDDKVTWATGKAHGFNTQFVILEDSIPVEEGQVVDVSKDLKEKFKVQKDSDLQQQITDLQLALVELYESIVGGA